MPQEGLGIVRPKFAVCISGPRTEPVGDRVTGSSRSDGHLRSNRDPA